MHQTIKLTDTTRTDSRQLRRFLDCELAGSWYRLIYLQSWLTGDTVWLPPSSIYTSISQTFDIDWIDGNQRVLRRYQGTVSHFLTNMRVNRAKFVRKYLRFFKIVYGISPPFDVRFMNCCDTVICNCSSSLTLSLSTSTLFLDHFGWKLHICSVESQFGYNREID